MELKRRPRAERSWTSKGKDCRGNCVMSRVSLIYLRRLRVASKKICSGSYKRLSKTPKVRRGGLKRHKVSKKKNTQRETAAAEDEMRKIREEIVRNEERFRLLSDKVDKNRMAEAEISKNSKD